MSDEEAAMDVTVLRVEQCETTFGGLLRRVRAGLGVTSFGMSVVDMPAHFQGHTEHDHGHDGQEEVYSVLTGSAVLQVGPEEHELVPGVFARIGPGQKRKVVTRHEPARILMLSGTPGEAYVPPVWTEEGAGEPLPPEERWAQRRAQLADPGRS